MKILVFAIIASMAIAVIVSISLFTLHENRSPCAFCPMIPSQPLANTSSIQNTSTETNQTSTSISNIIIPASAEDPSSGKNYEPRYLIVVLGINNTVKWTNESPSAAHTIVADNHDDPLFWNVTRSANSVLLLPGKSFNFTFTNAGEFQYDTDPHPWMYGWVLVLPQSIKNVIQTVTLNASSGIPDPCETFRMPCPFHPSNYNFTAQRFGSDIYIEKVTGNGIDNYAIIKPDKTCFYPPTYSNSCINPDDLAILRMVGVDTSIPQEDVNIAITGLKSQYAIGDPVSPGVWVKGYGRCDYPSVLVINQGVIVWQSKALVHSCFDGMMQLDSNYSIADLGGPFSLNQTGTYTVHINYNSNFTESNFNVTSQEVTSQPNQIADAKTNPFGITALIIYRPALACLGPPGNTTMPSCPSNIFYLKINSNSTAYLLGYNICDDNSCAKNNNLSLLLPINTALNPNYQSIGLPVNLQWKFGDTVNIQLKVSPVPDNKAATLLDLGNSTIVP